MVAPGGADALKGNSEKHKPLKRDRHKEVANTLGVGHDYLHSKILADNNIRPDSTQRRIEMDREWEELQQEIQRDFHDYSSSSSIADIDKYMQCKRTEKFRDPMQKLDQMAKRCLEAIISDSMRFNGRSPVRHARPFRFEERIREAILHATKK